MPWLFGYKLIVRSSEKILKKVVLPAVMLGRTLLDEVFKLVPVHHFRSEGLSSFLLLAGLSSALRGLESEESKCDV